jgi:hypothetical protein
LVPLLIEAWTHAQLWLRRNDGDIHGLMLILIGQAGGAKRSPHSRKAGTDNQNLFTHDGFTHC